MTAFLPAPQSDRPAPLWPPVGPEGGDAEEERLEGETVVRVRT
ncbi:hypothetical protein [Streptomyces sp. NPDC087294]